MAMRRYALCSILVLSLFVSSVRSKESVLTLDHTNFTETISKHDFIVVEFYAPWCGHCKQLAPEYEKAASELSSHVPPLVLAKIDASDEKNKEFATKYSVQGFPTIKILRNGGKAVQDYNGPRESDGIVTYLKKQSGPASFEIKSADDAAEVVGDKNVVAVGVFPKLSGSEFNSFMATAEKLRSDYDFAHTLDAKLLPRGEFVTGPVVRLFKPFDELFVDSRDFVGEALETFVKESSIPLITVFDNDPNNHPYVLKFFELPNTKALFFINFNGEGAESLKSKYREVAAANKGHGLSFLLGDAANSQEAFQHYGVEESQLPLMILHTVDDKKMEKFHSTKKSQPIPTENNEPVKVVVAESLDEMVFNSGKNVLLEFYAPWCGHCQNLVPILDEVAVSYQSDPSVVIAKFDATANDFPRDTFDVKGFPTIYLRTTSGNTVLYVGDRTKEDIISFIDKNKDTAAETKMDEKITEEVKDEL
ncbi:Protein disulfide isomerase-like 1-1 [Raphanus sativus]|nr:Protein disulfide isomerase-like 1-1 [Raphanus sativus]